MKRSKRIRALIGLSALLWLSLALVVGAIPPPAPTYWGSVLVNGSNVSSGTPISAWIDGVRWAEALSIMNQGKSQYALTVPSDDPETAKREGGRAGETIHFKIGDQWADQTGIWQEAGVVQLDLSIGSAPVYHLRYLPVIVKQHPAPPQPTATPTRTPTITPTRTPTATRSPTTVPSFVTIDRIEDTYIRVDKDVAYGRSGEDPGQLKIKTSQESMRPLIRFDLSGIPPNAIIDSAVMTLHTNLFPFGVPPAWPMNVSCYLLLRPWAQTEATWYVASTGAPWGTAGAGGPADREGSPVAITQISAKDTPYQFDITAAVQEWVSGAHPNYGLILLGDGNISEYRFHSIEGLLADKRPKLEISLRLP